MSVKLTGSKHHETLFKCKLHVARDGKKCEYVLLTLRTWLFGQRTKDCVPNVGVLPFKLARGQSCWTLSELAIDLQFVFSV